MQELSKDAELNALIIELNTQEQLFAKGIDSSGGSIGEYAAETILIKEKKGQPTDRITLKDTGDFYGSWRVELDSENNLQILATDWKTEGLKYKYGEQIIGLTPESMSKVVSMARGKVKEIVAKFLLAA